MKCLLAGMFLLVFGMNPVARAQTSVPFEVSNPAQQKWSPAEAQRIYSWACELLAKTVRPENPPRLHPRFRLVLGADENIFVRDHGMDEIRLKGWDPIKFAEGVVAIAVREVVQSNEQAQLARRSVMLANSTIDAHEKH
jgi:hypothetical protein